MLILDYQMKIFHIRMPVLRPAWEKNMDQLAKQHRCTLNPLHVKDLITPLCVDEVDGRDFSRGNARKERVGVFEVW
jgi:hypothetical protein